MVSDDSHAERRPSVALQNVCKSYRTPRGGMVHAVRELDMSVAPGERLALLGPNGAGKSSTIDVLLGLTAPDQGQVSVLGRRPADAVKAELVGAMLQTGALIRDVTVGELVRTFASLYESSLDAEGLLAATGLAGIDGRRTQKLSGGQAQRVRLALALVSDPTLLVLDEPTVGLDVESRRRFWDSIRAFAAGGGTVVFATHHLEEADAHADRAVLMGHGRAIADGPIPELRAGAGRRRVRATLDDVPAAELRTLAGVADADRQGRAINLVCHDSDAAVRALLAAHPSVRDLEVQSPRLEDAFAQAIAGEDLER